MSQLQNDFKLPGSCRDIADPAPATDIPRAVIAVRRSGLVRQPFPCHQVIKLLGQGMHLRQGCRGIDDRLWKKFGDGAGNTCELLVTLGIVLVAVQLL